VLFRAAKEKRRVKRYPRPKGPRGRVGVDPNVATNKPYGHLPRLSTGRGKERNVSEYVRGRKKCQGRRNHLIWGKKKKGSFGSHKQKACTTKRKNLFPRGRILNLWITPSARPETLAGSSREGKGPLPTAGKRGENGKSTPIQREKGADS